MGLNASYVWECICVCCLFGSLGCVLQRFRRTRMLCPPDGGPDSPVTARTVCERVSLLPERDPGPLRLCKEMAALANVIVLTMTLFYGLHVIFNTFAQAMLFWSR